MAKVTEIREGNGGGRAPPGFRQRPHNIEVEQRLLGILMVNNDALSRVRERLRSEHFYEPGHAALYEQTRQRIINGRLADVSSLSAGMDETGREAMYRLAQSSEVIPPEEIEQCTDELITLWQRRKAIEVAENLVNASYDLEVPADEWRLKAIEDLQQVEREAPQRVPSPCSLPSLDWARIANEEPPPERWLIPDWLPVGTSGILAGPGAAGKSYLELIKLIELALGKSFLRHYEIAEPVICLAYFSEDNAERLWRRVRKICAALNVDPNSLIGKLEIVSTVGAHRHLITAEANSPKTRPDDWLHQVHDRARALKARYVSTDHVGRYWAINRNDPNQVFSAFSHLDELATSIEGSVCMLAHPSKTDIRAKSQSGSFSGSKHGGQSAAQLPFIGGSAAMYDAPRWVHILDSAKTSDGKKFRVLTNDKPNYSRRFAAKLEEDSHGVVQFAGEVDPDDPAGAKSAGGINSRGRPAKADRTFLALEEMFQTHRRGIALDELVTECVKRGIVSEAQAGSDAWRDRRRTIRDHLDRFSNKIDARDNDTYALNP